MSAHLNRVYFCLKNQMSRNAQFCAFYKSRCQTHWLKRCKRNVAVFIHTNGATIGPNSLLYKQERDLDPFERTMNSRLLQRLQSIFSGGNKSNDQNDNIPEGYSMVYKAPMLSYAKALYFAVVGGIFVIPAVGLAYIFGEGDYTKPITGTNVILAENSTEQLIYILSFVGLVLVLQAFLRRYTQRIYYNDSSNEFIATFFKVDPFSQRQLRFKGGEMNIVTKMTKLRQDVVRDIYIVKNRRLILFEEYFQLPRYYNLMLGYDSPDEEKDIEV